MGAKLGRSSGPNSDLNLTPMIDIVLVVLIIMMVNMPIKINELGVKLPSVQTDQPKPQNPADQLVIALYKNGTTALNRKLMQKSRLVEQITRRLRSQEKKNVFIDAHPDVAYGDMVALVDLAKLAGASQVGLARLKPNGPLDPTSTDSGALARGVYAGSPMVANQGGELDEQQADAVLEKLMPNIRACYLQTLATEPGLTGHVVVRTAIGPQGQHLEPPLITGASSLESEKLFECLQPILASLAYPPLGNTNTAAVQYQLLFSPG